MLVKLDLEWSPFAYLRVKNERKTTISFVIYNCRVAPLKFLIIPRLERVAALVAARLASTMVDEVRISIDRHVLVGFRNGTTLDSLYDL